MRRSQPIILAHRGASAEAPENSLEAFEKARAQGADGVELDVRLCASGEVLVFHDADLSRLADRPERVAQLPWSTLRQVRLRSGARIPTLAEVFEVCGADMVVNVEIKADALWRPGLSALVEGVAKVVADVPRPERVLISSFNPLAVMKAASAMPRVLRGLLFESEGPVWARGQALARWLPIQAVHPQNHLCTPHAVAAWKAAGLAINVWTVDDATRQHELFAMGVDAIITNQPGPARERLDRLLGPPARISEP